MDRTLSRQICQCGLDLTVRGGYSHTRCETCQRFWFSTKIELSEDAIVPQNRQTGFHCPQCKTALNVGKIGTTEVCYCDSCRGFVIDSQSLGQLIATRRKAYRGPDDKPIAVNLRELDLHQSCPACFETMEPHHYCGPGNVILDTCRGCQLAWLDHGEISKIARAPGVR